MFKIKKAISTLLTASMMLSYAVTASAADSVSISVLKPNPGYKVSVEVDNEAVTNQAVTWYKLNSETQEYELIENASGDKWSITNDCAGTSIKACVDGVFSNEIAVGAAAEKPVRFTPTDQPATTPTENIFVLPNHDTLPLVLLDSEETDDGKKQYLIYINARVGSGIFYYGNSDYTKFDPEDPNSIGYWLNKEYLLKDSPAKNDTTVTSYTILALPQSVRTYIDKDHVWLTEAGFNSEVANDYTVEAGIVPMSYTEFKEYYQKIGYEDFENTYLRSALSNPTSSNKMLISGNKAAGLSSTDSDWDDRRIRPIFWLEEDFFKNVKIDLSKAGDNVIDMLGADFTVDELYNAGYTDGELSAAGLIKIPEISAISISVQVAKPGYPVRAVVTSDEENAESNIRWYVSDAEDGEYTAVAGASGNNWQIFNACANKFIKAAVGDVFSNAIAVGPAAESPVGFVPDDQPETSPEENIFKLSGSEHKDYPYILLDSAETADGKKQYFVLTKWNLAFGVFHKGDESYTRFDPADENGIAYWLNTELLNKDEPQATEPGVDGAIVNSAKAYGLPQSVRTYIDKDHLWLTEAGYNDDVKNDYTFNAAIALLSFTEFKQYYKKIGYDDFENGYLRSPSTQRQDRVMMTNDKTAGVKQNANGWGNRRIRPVFWLEEDFFKNVKLDPGSVGKNVANILKNDYTAEELSAVGYTDDELMQMGVFNAPSVDSLNISVEVKNPGYPVSVSFTSSDENVTAETINPYIRWYVSDTEDGDYTVVAGASGNDWQIFNVCAGKFIKAAVGDVFSNAIEIGAAAEKPVTFKPENQPADTKEEYLFRLADDTNQTFILLDTAKKGDKHQYLLLGKEHIGTGTFHINDKTQTKFDINDPENIAYWLNNELLLKSSPSTDGELVESVTPARLPQAVKKYIDTEHVWLTEAGYNDNVKNDYTFKAGLAYLSYTEFKKYSHIIGYNETDFGKTFLRSANSAAADRILHIQHTGDGLNSVSNDYASRRIKPIYWVWDDLFKNQKFDVESMGSEVKKAMLKTITRSEAKGAGYTDEELAAIGYTDLSAYAENVVVSGTVAVGQRLAARYTFNDNGLSKTEGTGTIYQWYIADSQDGNFVAISGADSAHYVVREEDLGKFLKVLVTPFDSAGNICEKGISASTSAVRESLDISARFVSFTDASGEVISSVGSNTSITANFEIENLADAVSMVIVVAVYNDNNVMVAVHPQTVNVAAGKAVYSSTLSGFTAGNYKVKAMVLDSLDSLKPICVDERL